MLYCLLDPNIVSELRQVQGVQSAKLYPKASLLPGMLGLQEMDEYIDRNEAHLPDIARVWLNGRPLDIDAHARLHRTGNRHAVKNALRAGALLEVSGLETGHSVVSTICAALEDSFGGRAKSKVVLAPRGRLPMAARFDAGAMFIVQLHGKAQWMRCGQQMNHPLSAMSRTLAPSEIEAQRVVPSTLHPGDVLFVPAGVGYGALDVVAEPTMHAAFNVQPLSPLDLLRRAFDEIAPSIESLRVPLYPDAADFQCRMDEAVADLLGALIAQPQSERLRNFRDVQTRSVGHDISVAAALGAVEKRVLQAKEPGILLVKELLSRGWAGPASPVATASVS